jgi:hypothetical protein
MTEVSSWSATDASNSLTPPDGWPEGMQPSGVNDVGRMMMGAIRRWYNTVTAGIANCLPLSGGTLTGPLNSTADITSTGRIQAGGTLAGGYITSAGSIDAANAVNAPTINATNINASGNIGANGNIQAVGTLSGGYITSGGSIDAANAINAPTINAANQLNTANVNASTLVNTNKYQLAGLDFAIHGVDGLGTVNSILDTGGLPAIDIYGGNGTYYRAGLAHFFTNRTATFNVCRFQTTDGNCINASGLWNSVSDASVKEAVEPYRAGLRELLSLNPVSYRYIPGKSPFAIEGQTYYGLVAQEVEPVLPEMVGRTDDGLATVAPGHLVLVLVSAVKELEARLAQLENRGG